MGFLADLLNERRNAPKEAARQKALSELIGTPAVQGDQFQASGPGGEPGLIGHLGGREATGSEAVPVDQRAMFLAAGSTLIPGFNVKDSMSMATAAVGKAADRARRASEFNQTLVQNQQQFTDAAQQKQQNWVAEQSIRDEKWLREKEVMAMQLAAGSRKLDLDVLLSTKNQLAIDQAQVDIQSLDAAGRVEMQGTINESTFAREQLEEFERIGDAVVIDSLLNVIGLKQIQLLMKTAKNDTELSALAWWRKEFERQNDVTKEKGGVTINPTEEARLLRTFITPNMDRKVMIKLLQQRITEANERARVFIQVWGTAHNDLEKRLGASGPNSAARVSLDFGGGTGAFTSDNIPLGNTGVPEGVTLKPVSSLL